MKKQLLLFILMLLPLAASADPVEIDGIYYNLVSEGQQAEVTSKPSQYSGDITIPESVEYNGVTYSVTSIGYKAFYDCRGLTSIAIPNSVTSIGYAAFSGCSGLTSITIPNSVTSIGGNAFNGCSGLTSITIPNSVTSIGDYVFANCDGLRSITIPNSVTSIGRDAFSDCDGLRSITIPNSVTSIGSYAFMNCTSLSSIDIPNSVTSIGSAAFHKTAWYNYQPDGLVYAGKVAYEYKGTMPANTSITIKEGTLGIAGSAFAGCSGLKSITIPNSVTTIGDAAFAYCHGLTSIEIPNSVTSIGDDAFYYCDDLTSIEIPNSVTSIGDNAFSGCRWLFSVTIPNGVTTIGDEAFCGCSHLTSITCLATNPPSCGLDVFYNVDKSVCTLKVPEVSINLYKAADEWKDFSIIETTGIQELRNEKIEGLKYYDLNGNQSPQPRKGLNIVRMSNGKAKKVLVK